MSEKCRLDRKIGFRNTFYTNCINVIIDSIGPLIILRSIYYALIKVMKIMSKSHCLISVECRNRLTVRSMTENPIFVQSCE